MAAGSEDSAPPSQREGSTPVWVSDDELAEAALAADRDEPIADDARPFGIDDEGPGLLPSWYAPAPRGYRRTPGRRVAVVGIIAALLIVNGAGLCVTYGWPEIAW